MSDVKSDNSTVPEFIYKQEEFDLMLEMIQSGIWRTCNLSKALHVDENTIISWKKKPEAIEAHRKAILKFVKRRTDVELILKELDIASDPNITALTQNNYFNLNDDQLDQLIGSKIRQIGAGATNRGERTPDGGESA